MPDERFNQQDSINEAFAGLQDQCRVGINASEYGTCDRDDDSEYHGEE